MKFTAPTIAALLATSVSAAPTASNCPARASDCFNYEVQGFTEVKQNGRDLSNVYFELKDVNSQAKAIPCSPYDPVTGKTTTTFNPKNVYFCGKDSPFSFLYNPDYGVQTNELYIWQNIGKDQSLGGKAVFSDPLCRAGGNGALMCTIPPQQKISLTVAKL